MHAGARVRVQHKQDGVEALRYGISDMARTHAWSRRQSAKTNIFVLHITLQAAVLRRELTTSTHGNELSHSACRAHTLALP